MKVLILKTGHSETLDPEISQHASLGDVLRSTVILHPFRQEHITWVTDKVAYPLLHGLVDRLLVWDFETALQLLFEKYDIVVNLEKSPSVCALAGRIDAWQKYGFRFDDIAGEARPYKDSIGAWGACIEPEEKATHSPWQATLFEMIGMEWSGEQYLLGIKPTTEMVKGRIGLNHKVGGKFPGKAWPWFNDLDGEIGGLKGTCWQEGDNLQDYVNWINSCEIIVTNDSLGLHMAIAMGRKFVALFGPTLEHEVFTYGLGSKIIAENGDMATISVEAVRKEVQKLLAS